LVLVVDANQLYFDARVFTNVFPNRGVDEFAIQLADAPSGESFGKEPFRAQLSAHDSL
jgi:hypothetical protein